MMKGLLYKEFLVGRKIYLIFLALSLLFSVLGFLVCLSMICGNLDYLLEEPELAQNVAEICVYLPFILLLFAANGVNHSIYSDYESGWMRYSYTLPVKAERAVCARCLGGILVFAFSFFYGLAYAWVIQVLTRFPLTAEVLKNMLVFLTLAVFLYSWNLPLALKYKTSRAVSVRIVICVAALYIVCALQWIRGLWRSEDRFWGNGETGEVYLVHLAGKYETVRDALLPFLPFLILGMLGISFFLSVKIYRRREADVRTFL